MLIIAIKIFLNNFTYEATPNNDSEATELLLNEH